MQKGVSKLVFIVVSLFLVLFLGSIVLKFAVDFINTTAAGGKPASLASDLLGGL